MSKIKYLIIFSFVFLGGCFAPYERVDEYERYKANILSLMNKENQKNVRFARACEFREIGFQYYQNCIFAFAYLNQEQANVEALEKCKKRGFRNQCVLYNNENWETLYQKQIVEKKIDNYIQQCEYIGFKRNTEKMSDCVLKISQTEKQIVNTQSNNSSGDTLANLIILQESLKLLQPPANPKRNVQCTYNTVGGILGVNCF